jgi:hypothetical protein
MVGEHRVDARCVSLCVGLWRSFKVKGEKFFRVVLLSLFAVVYVFVRACNWSLLPLIFTDIYFIFASFSTC